MAEIQGSCAPPFAAVREAFARNFTERGEIGASLAVVQDGELVVDLWGGYRDSDSGAIWRRDTLGNVWSTTKGITAICFAILVERGLLNYEDPVARYWPEFGLHGKDAVSVGTLLSHQAGLCGFDSPASTIDFYDAETAALRLASQRPFWTPGTQSGYHAISIGLLATALFRRIEGRSLRDFVADELSRYHISIGLPAEHANCAATMYAPPEMGSAALMSELSPAQVAALANPPLDPLLPNQAAWRGAEIPSANGFATAEGLARLYADFLEDGALVSKAAREAATAIRIDNIDAVLGRRARWAAGFLRNTDGMYGPGDAAFGHSGWGGAFAFADPSKRMSMAYVMNLMGTDLIGDPRSVALIEACYRSF